MKLDTEGFKGKVRVQYDRRSYCAYLYTRYSPYYLDTEVLNFKILEHITQKENTENN